MVRRTIWKNICLYLQRMKRNFIINVLKFLVLSLVFVLISRTEADSVQSNVSTDCGKEIRIPDEDVVRTGHSSFSMPEPQCRIPRQSNLANTLRVHSQAQRQNHTPQSRHGFTMTKSGKSMNEYSTSLFFISILDFPSGLNESSHHLIRLRKLII